MNENMIGSCNTSEERTINRWSFDFYVFQALSAFRSGDYSAFSHFTNIVESLVVRPMHGHGDLLLKLRFMQFLSRINSGDKLDLTFEEPKTPLESALDVLESICKELRVPEREHQRVRQVISEMLVMVCIRSGEFQKAEEMLRHFNDSPDSAGKRKLLLNLISRRRSSHSLLQLSSYSLFKQSMVEFIQSLYHIPEPFLLQMLHQSGAPTDPELRTPQQDAQQDVHRAEDHGAEPMGTFLSLNILRKVYNLLSKQYGISLPFPHPQVDLETEQCQPDQSGTLGTCQDSAALIPDLSKTKGTLQDSDEIHTDHSETQETQRDRLHIHPTYSKSQETQQNLLECSIHCSEAQKQKIRLEIQPSCSETQKTQRGVLKIQLDCFGTQRAQNSGISVLSEADKSQSNNLTILPKQSETDSTSQPFQQSETLSLLSHSQAEADLEEVELHLQLSESSPILPQMEQEEKQYAGMTISRLVVEDDSQQTLEEESVEQSQEEVDQITEEEQQSQEEVDQNRANEQQDREELEQISEEEQQNPEGIEENQEEEQQQDRGEVEQISEQEQQNQEEVEQNQEEEEEQQQQNQEEVEQNQEEEEEQQQQQDRVEVEQISEQEQQNSLDRHLNMSSSSESEWLSTSPQKKRLRLRNVSGARDQWSDEDSVFTSCTGSPNRKYRSKKSWTEQESEWLREGVKRYGAGQWQKIRSSFPFNNRTAVNLKDRWRTMIRLRLV